MLWDVKKFAYGLYRPRLAACLLVSALFFPGCMTDNKYQDTANIVDKGTEIKDKGLPLLFSVANPDGPEPAHLFAEEKRVRMVELDSGIAADAGAQLYAAKNFVVNLFADVSMTVEVDRTEIKEPGRFTMNGHLAGVDGSYFLLTFNQGAVSATVFHPLRGYYDIEPTGGLWGKVSEFDPNKLPNLGFGMVYPDSTHSHMMDSTMPMPMPKTAATTPVLDIMILYTAAAAAGVGGETAMLSRIDKAVAEINTAFFNSQINAKMNLVHAQQINYAETGNMGTDLSRLQNASDGYLDDVAALRNTYKADFVSLVVNFTGSGTIGIGYVMTSPASWFKDYAFTVIGSGYTGTYNTLAHEVGHNLGCNHDRQNSSGQAAYPYSYGYRFNGTNGVQYRDIMSYPPGTQIPYYSNPNVMFMGVPEGIPDGVDQSADNARTINATAPVAEAFFVHQAALPPVPTIITPAVGVTFAGGMTINFSGSGTDPVDGNLPASAFTWQVDFHHDAQTDIALGPTSGMTSGSFTVANRGQTTPNVWYRITLTVKDAAGLTTSIFRDLQPIKSSITLATNPAGLQLKLDGQVSASPLTFTGVAGMIRTIEAVSPQVANGSNYAFGTWSDGGTQAHDLTTPASNATLTAAYTGTVISNGWNNQDVGTVGLAGSYGLANGTFTVKGSGADIWGTADGFQYVYQTLSGDGMITARVAAMQATNGWAMAGVMIRENTTEGSRHAFLAVSPINGLTLNTRETTGGITQSIRSAGAAPYWVRLVRSGPSLKAYASADGITWTLRGESVQTLPQNVLVGLALTSHDNTLLNTTTFDNVSVVKDTWSSSDVGVVQFPGGATGYGTVQVTGDGADIWNNADGFFYTYRSLSGDGEIKARVTGVQNTDQWAKAGVMIRESLAAGSKHVSLFVTSANGIAFQRREVTDAGSLHVGVAGAAPSWVKLVRAGNLFSSYMSADGVTWTLVGTATVAMGTDVKVGLAVTSHHNGTPNLSTFDQITVTD